ncbi:hypothetical protein HHK36_023132 [Tetracentron sinense]|uniref:Mediator of RNA polymerase II transcription subunit 22 n=1 Tax=Tetracentron sinense TaxID=13715 RepID=A0A834YQR0_TETSI|nr:hypothetical protein HHK36_023132 [Tetracentron sinense]
MLEMELLFISEGMEEAIRRGFDWLLVQTDSSWVANCVLGDLKSLSCFYALGIPLISYRRREVNDPPVRNSQEAFMMEMRAARMVQAADSLLKLVSELKQTAIFSGFASLNDHVEQRTTEFNQQAEKTDRMLARIGEEAAASLKELEVHYYSSAQRTNQPEP